MIDKEQIGKRFLRLRKTLKLSQTAFGEAIDVKRETISQIENGAIAPSLDIILKVISQYKVGFDSLFFNEDFGTPVSVTFDSTKVEELEHKVTYLEKAVTALEQSNKDKDRVIELLSSK